MKSFNFIASTVFFFSLLLPGYAAAETLTQVRLVDPLDEPEFYCLDLSGWGEHLKLDDPLQAHTCKTQGADDQQFAFADGRIRVGTTDRCLEVAGSGTTLPGSAVIARKCSDNPLQALELDDDGRIKIAGTGLCIAAGDQSTEASGPSHMWRVLAVQECAAAMAEQAIWQIGL